MRTITGVSKSLTQLAAIVAAVSSVHVSAAPTLGVDPLADVVSAMSLQEKIKLVRGTGMEMPQSDEESGPAVGETGKGKVAGAAGNTYAIPRLGIPSIVLADGPAGLRIQPHRKNQPDKTFYATAFPIATLLASTWDLSLVEEVGKSMGEETKEYGVDILLAPGMNIQRYPLGGRNFEYYSEDPLLTGKVAAAMVRGIQSNGVGTSIKHYVANNHEWNRNQLDVKVDEKTLQEIYLKGFEIAVKESQPWTVMSSYNKVNGTYTSESYDLLSKILRQDWGFQGFVMSDWFGGADPMAQIEAGNDLLMPGTDKQEQTLLAAAEAGKLDETALDRSVKAILKIILKTPTFQGYDYSDAPNLKHNAQVARQAAAEGMVLLKNHNHSLPLTPNTKLAIFGNASYQMITGGTGSGDVNEAYSVSLLQGLANQDFLLSEPLNSLYSAYLREETEKRPKPEGFAAFLPQTPIAEMPIAKEAVLQAAEANEVALITLGRTSGEFADRDEANFSLSEAEQALLETVSTVFKAQGKPVIVVLNIGGPIEMVSWRDKVDAILLAWQPGQESGNAIADILDGEVTPSGKLTSSFPVNLHDFPSAKGFPGVVDDPTAKPSSIMGTQPSTVSYTDAGKVGYRYFNAGNKPVAYPFGFGLSYTSFKYSDVKFSKFDGSSSLTIDVTVKNTGKFSGKEVVQVYASSPTSTISANPATLRAFQKTRLLEPGKAETLTFVIPAESLAEYNPDLSTWQVVEGKYKFAIGSSSRQIHKRKTVSLKGVVK